MRPGRFAILLLALIAVGCEAEPSPTARTRTMTATISIPVAGRGFNNEAEAVFFKRLSALGIREFGVSTDSTDDLMRWTMQVPTAIDDEVVDAVLRRAGLFQFVPWPAGEEGPAPGDAVPAGLQPLFDDPTEFQSAAVTTDSAGQFGVDFTLGPVAREAIATYTTQHIGSTLPFVLDGFVLTAPIIYGPIADGVLRLTGPDPPPVPLAAIVAMIASGPLPAAWR
jgi:hypothetical protein